MSRSDACEMEERDASSHYNSQDTERIPCLRHEDLSPSLEAVVLPDHEEKQLAPDTLGLTEKQVAGADEKELAKDYAYGLPMSSGNDLETDAQLKRPIARGRHRRHLVWAIVALSLLILAVGLGVGLGIGLRPGQEGKTQSNKGDQFFSTRGAFNGTAIRAAAGDGSMWITYPEYSGDIRRRHLSWPGLSRISTDIVAVDARNGTPISNAEVTVPNQLQAHVFYVGKDQMLKQRVFDNVTSSWSPGPLNAQELKVLDSDRIGMNVAYYSGPILNDKSSQDSVSFGLRLWYATSETTFDQMAWRPGYSKWIFEQSWDGQNAHAAPAFDGLLPGHTTYLLFVNHENNVDLYWRDSANNVESTTEHPINVWENFTNNLPTVDPDVGLTLSWNRLLYARSTEGEIVQGWNMSFAAENTTITSSPLPPFDGECLPNSILDVWTQPIIGPKGTLLYCQTRGDDITIYGAIPQDESWNKNVLPLHDD